MIFETGRLTIRRLQKTDFEGFYDMQRNPKVMQHIKKTMNCTESETELVRFINYYEDDEVYFNIWAVEKKDTKEFIGICGVYENELAEYEIAYRLRELYWKKGLGTEIAKNLIKYCFEVVNLPEIAAYVRVQNKGSITILEKEMRFATKVQCKKTNLIERLYKLKKVNWQP